MSRLVRAGLVLLLLVSTTSVAQWGEVRQCQIYPASYAFATAEVQREPETSCSIVGTNYTVCAGPSTLTDSELGPQDNTTFNSSYYYTWQGRHIERYFILFTFNQTESISNITLHYYVHSENDTQPTVTAFGVEEEQTIQSPNLTGRVYRNILLLSTSARGLHSASLIRQQSTALINISTARIVLQIRGRGGPFNLSISEIDILAATSQPCPSPPATDQTRTTATSTSISTPPSRADTTGSPPLSTIDIGVSAGLAAITVLTVAAVVAMVCTIVYRRCGGKQAGKGAEFAIDESGKRVGKGAEFAMDENQCYTSVSASHGKTTPPSSEDKIYDDIITSLGTSTRPHASHLATQ